MDDGNHEMLVLRCEREPIEYKYTYGDIDDWDEVDGDTRFPQAVEYVGFGTGCAMLLQGECICYLEHLFQTHQVVAASPVCDLSRYNDETDFCLDPRGSAGGDRYADVSYLVLQSELDARTEDATECEYAPRATKREKEACCRYNGILFAAYSMIRQDLEERGLDELPPPGELGRRARGRVRYPHVLLRELVQRGRTRLISAHLLPTLSTNPTEALLDFLYDSCPVEVFQCILRCL